MLSGKQKKLRTATGSFNAMTEHEISEMLADIHRVEMINHPSCDRFLEVLETTQNAPVE